MKVWRIGLGLAFLYAVHAMVYDFEKCSPKKLPENWYTLAFATNSSMISEYLDGMSMMAATLSTGKDGSFNVSSTVPTPYGCLSMDVIFTKKEDGMYSSNTEWGKSTILDVKTDCKTYSAVTVLHERHGAKSFYVTLYGQKKTATEEAKEIFANLAAKMGLGKEHCIEFPPEVACAGKRR